MTNASCSKQRQIHQSLLLSEFATKMQDKKTWLTVSILKFIPERPLTVHCSVFNDAFPTPKLSETIQIKFQDYLQPKVHQFTRNQELELECEDQQLVGKQYKWIINGNEISTETQNTLKILQINESYDNSRIKCFSYNPEQSKFILVNNFHLEFIQKKSELIKKPLPVAEPMKSIVTVKNKNKNIHKNKSRTTKRVFTCVAEQDIPEDPKYIWIDGRLQKSVSSLRSMIFSKFFSTGLEFKK